MKIQFTAHQKTERQLELSQQELFQLFEIMKEEFKDYITYGRFTRIHMPTKTEQSVVNYCQQYGVDVEYDKDRITFFTAILDNLKNPYQ
jgi:hypothetical protein